MSLEIAQQTQQQRWAYVIIVGDLATYPETVKQRLQRLKTIFSATIVRDLVTCPGIARQETAMLREVEEGHVEEEEVIQAGGNKGSMKSKNNSWTSTRKNFHLFLWTLSW